MLKKILLFVGIISSSQFSGAAEFVQKNTEDLIFVDDDYIAQELEIFENSSEKEKSKLFLKYLQQVEGMVVHSQLSQPCESCTDLSN